MKRISLRLLLIATAMIHTLNAVCPLGSFQELIDSPFDTGLFPDAVAYSPLVSGNLLAGVVNFGDNTVSVYHVDTANGNFTPILPPVDTELEPYLMAFSPIFNGQLYAAVPNFSNNTISIFNVNPVTGVFTPVFDSPFPSQGSGPFIVAYSPIVSDKLFLAVGNSNDNTISVYQVDSITGGLTAVAGSTINTGSIQYGLAYSPIIAGKLFAAVANYADNTVSVYQVDTDTGIFTPLLPLVNTGSGPVGIAYSPVIAGKLFAATANYNDNTISVYQVDTNTGAFTLISPPVATGIQPYDIAYSPLVNGNLFAAVPNFASNNASVYQVDTETGLFTPVLGSPFDTDAGPIYIAFSPLLSGGLFAAIPNYNSDTVSVYQVTLLIPTITTSSMIIFCSRPITIDATIEGGTPPFTVVWSDGLIQTVSGAAVSRTVTPGTTTSYQITSVTDSNGCVAGPSNSITIRIIGFCCNH